MRIRQAEFAFSVFRPQDLQPSPYPEIAFVGRSNVGKSSVINCLANRRRLAFVSKTPGRTQALNFYRINQNQYWVDFPGYGFARQPRATIARWKQLAEYYLQHRVQLRGVILIMDSRHAPTDLDDMLVEWLAQYGRPIVAVMTKVDCLNQRERAQAHRRIDVWPWRSYVRDVIWFSARTGEGRIPLLAWIQKLCTEENP